MSSTSVVQYYNSIQWNNFQADLIWADGTFKKSSARRSYYRSSPYHITTYSSSVDWKDLAISAIWNHHNIICQ